MSHATSRVMTNIGENVVRLEAAALCALADRIAGVMAGDFHRALELLYGCAGRVVVTGMGKSGMIARKIAATLNSTGTPALFLHPAEAMHGDLGNLVRGDVVVALSASGETAEILHLLATVKRLGIPLVTMTCDELYPAGVPRTLSTLAQAATVALDCSVAREACALGLAPTASTTSMLALGDALAVALAERRGFKEEDFANLHPGGKLGKRLARVHSLMHGGQEIPSVPREAPISEVVYEMSRKKLGMTTVVSQGKLVGIISDGDLRRLLERHGKNALDLSAGQCMTAKPQTIAPDEFATAALDIMERRKMTSLPVVDAQGTLLGVLHLHDLWGTQML
jgi:arabinose-5-phosphate isomerase